MSRADPVAPADSLKGWIAELEAITSKLEKRDPSHPTLRAAQYHIDAAVTHLQCHPAIIKTVDAEASKNVRTINEEAHGLG